MLLVETHTHTDHWKQHCQQNTHSKTASLQTEAKPVNSIQLNPAVGAAAWCHDTHTHTSSDIEHKSISHDKSTLSPQEHSIFFISMKRQ